MSESIYRTRWRRTGLRTFAAAQAAAPPASALPQQWALAQSALQDVLTTVQGLWEDAPSQYAAGNLDVVSAAQWSGAFAAEAAVIEGAVTALGAGN